MTEFQSSVDSEVHRKLAADLFNFTWDFIDKAHRSEGEDETMLYAAHASRFHWGMVGTTLHFARGEWLISRVYSLLGRSEPAHHHAKKSLDLCLDNHLSAFDLGFAHEAMARAYAVQGDMVQRDAHVSLANEAAAQVVKAEDRAWLLKNVLTVESLSLPTWGDD